MAALAGKDSKEARDVLRRLSGHSRNVITKQKSSIYARPARQHIKDDGPDEYVQAHRSGSPLSPSHQKQWKENATNLPSEEQSSHFDYLDAEFVKAALAKHYWYYDWLSWLAHAAFPYSILPALAICHFYAYKEDAWAILVALCCGVVCQILLLVFVRAATRILYGSAYKLKKKTSLGLNAGHNAQGFSQSTCTSVYQGPMKVSSRHLLRQKNRILQAFSYASNGPKSPLQSSTTSAAPAEARATSVSHVERESTASGRFHFRLATKPLPRVTEAAASSEHTAANWACNAAADNDSLHTEHESTSGSRSRGLSHLITTGGPAASEVPVLSSQRSIKSPRPIYPSDATRLEIESETCWRLRGCVVSAAQFARVWHPSLKLLHASTELAVSRLLRTFAWCIVWIASSYYVTRPTALAWFDFTTLIPDDDVRTASFWVEQGFLWMVYLDLVIDLAVAENKLRFVFSWRMLLDVLTMPITSLIMVELWDNLGYDPIDECAEIAQTDPFAFSVKQCGPFDPRPKVFLPQFGWLRFARLYATKHILARLGVFSPTQLALNSLVLSVVSLLSIFAGCMYWLEAPYPNLEYQGQTPPIGTFAEFHDFLYFSVVTLSTVGYGDFSPIFDIARLANVIFIVVGVVWVPAQLSALSEATSQTARIIGYIPEHRPFVLVVGDVQPDQLELFVGHHFQVGADLSREPPLPVVVLTPTEITRYHRRTRMALINGDILSPQSIPAVAVQKLDLHHASAVFLLSDVHRSITDTMRVVRQDHATTARLLVLSKTLPPERIHVMYKTYNDIPIAHDVGVRKIICLNQLKMRLLAKSCTDCPGAVTLMTNLLNASVQLRSALVVDAITREESHRSVSSGTPRNPTKLLMSGPDDEQSWQEQYASGADNNLVLRMLPRGLVGVEYWRAVEGVFAHTGAVLLGITSADDVSEQTVSLSPWNLRLSKEHVAIWISRPGPLQAVYELYAGADSFAEVPLAPELPPYTLQDELGTYPAEEVAMASRVQAWVRHRQAPFLSDLHTLMREKHDFVHNLVIVCGWPRNLSRLLQQLSDADFTTVVVAPTPLSIAALERLRGIRNASYLAACPLESAQLVKAGILRAALKSVLIFNEGLVEANEASHLLDQDVLLVFSKVLTLLRQSLTQKVSVIIEVSHLSSIALIDRSQFLPSDLHLLRSYLLSPFFASGKVYTDGLLFPMIVELKDGLPAVVDQLLRTTIEHPSLSLQPLPRTLRREWRNEAPPTYSHLVRACLERHWVPIGLLRIRKTGLRPHEETNFAIANPNAHLQLHQTDRVYVVRRRREVLAQRDGDAQQLESRFSRLERRVMRHHVSVARLRQLLSKKRSMD